MSAPESQRPHRRVLQPLYDGFANIRIHLLILLIPFGTELPIPLEAQPAFRKLTTVDDLGPIDSSPAIGLDGTIYFGTFRQTLIAMETNGVIKWRFKALSEIKSSPSVGNNGTIYFGSRDQNLYAVTPEGGGRWTFGTGGWIDSSPAIGTDGTVYFGSWDKYFYAVNPNGGLKWRFSTGGEIDGSAAIDSDDTIYFGSHDAKLYALDSAGRKKWDFTTGGPIISSPALDGAGNIYFTSVDGHLYALSNAGQLRWKMHTRGFTASSPVIGEDGAICVGVGRTLQAFTPDGKAKWTQWMVNLVEAPPVALLGTNVLAVSHFGDMNLYDSNHTQITNIYVALYGKASPAISPEGIIYVPAETTRFYILSKAPGLAKSPWPHFRANTRNTGVVNLVENR